MLDAVQEREQVRNGQLLCLSVLIGVLYQLLFWEKSLGISYPLFIAVVYAIMFWMLEKKPKLQVEFSSLLLIPVGLLSLTYALFSNAFFQWMNFPLIPLLILVQTMVMSGRNQNGWHEFGFIGEIIELIGRSLGSMLVPFNLLRGLVKTRTGEGQYATAAKIIIGLLMSLPIVVTVVILLSSADSVFSFYIGEIPRTFFENVSLSEWIFRFIQMVLVSVLFFGYVWALLHGKEANAIAEEKPPGTASRPWDGLIVVTVLVMLNIVYIFFTVIQFSYFFSGAAAGLPSGMTYAEYARQGFSELLLVTIINFAILTGIIHWVNRTSKRLFMFTKGLLTTFTFCTMIMLLSAYHRLSLYEEAYGYTEARLFAHAFIVFLFIIILIVFVKIWRDNISMIKTFVIVSLVFYTVLNYINMDATIAKNNIARYHETGKIDLYYLERLSYDAVPELTKLMEDPHLKESVKMILLGHKHAIEAEQTWQSYSFSKQKAWNVLKDREG